jgi:hypothetical protein
MASRTATPETALGEKRAIEESAHAELTRCGYAELRRVRCEHHEGVLTLRGTVPSYYLKQIAQSVMLKRFDGTIVVNNRLAVTSHRACSSAYP